MGTTNIANTAAIRGVRISVHTAAFDAGILLPIYTGTSIPALAAIVRISRNIIARAIAASFLLAIGAGATNKL